MSVLFNIEEILAKYNLTPETYEQLLNDCISKVEKISDLDWAEICVKYGLDFNPDTVRKGCQPPLVGSVFVAEYFKWKTSQGETKTSSSAADELIALKQEIRKEKQKLFDERNALNKTLREIGRNEEDLSIVKRIIEDRGHVDFPVIEKVNREDDGSDLVVCLSDFHLGINADNYFGAYDSNIAVDRLAEYLYEIEQIAKAHKIQNIYLILLGDLISGEIHITTQLENRENLCEQVVQASELISQFAYGLSTYANTLYINGVAGNHSRTSFKDQVLRGNRLDNLIPWYMKAKLAHIYNIKFIDEDNYDSTIATMNIRGHEYLAVHGDFDPYSKKGLADLMLMVDSKPSGIFYGHLHHCSMDEIADVKLVRSGSFAGTCDDYTVSKRIVGSPSQMVCVVTNKGIVCCYPVHLH